MVYMYFKSLNQPLKSYKWLSSRKEILKEVLHMIHYWTPNWSKLSKVFWSKFLEHSIITFQIQIWLKFQYIEVFQSLLLALSRTLPRKGLIKGQSQTLKIRLKPPGAFDGLLEFEIALKYKIIWDFGNKLRQKLF